MGHPGAALTYFQTLLNGAQRLGGETSTQGVGGLQAT